MDWKELQVETFALACPDVHTEPAAGGEIGAWLCVLCVLCGELFFLA